MSQNIGRFDKKKVSQRRGEVLRKATGRVCQITTCAKLHVLIALRYVFIFTFTFLSSIKSILRLSMTCVVFFQKWRSMEFQKQLRSLHDRSWSLLADRLRNTREMCFSNVLISSLEGQTLLPTKQTTRGVSEHNYCVSNVYKSHVILIISRNCLRTKIMDFCVIEQLGMIRSQ